jgi:hypothetical protein
MNPRILHLLTFYTVTIGWICFAAIFLLRRRAPRDKTKSANRGSILGIVIQSAALFTVWSIGQRNQMSIFSGIAGSDLVLLAIVLILVTSSLYMM